MHLCHVVFNYKFNEMSKEDFYEINKNELPIKGYRSYSRSVYCDSKVEQQQLAIYLTV